MRRVVGTPLPLPSLGNSGRHSGHDAVFEGFPMCVGFLVRDSFDADLVRVSTVVWPEEPFLQKVPDTTKCTLVQSGRV